MINWLKKYWIEVLVISVIGLVLLNACASSFTWMMADSDGPEYVMDALYFYPAHHTSAPLYLLTGHLFEMLPFGTIYWRMSFMSTLFTLGSLIFLYFIVREKLKEHKHQRFYALLAVMIFGGSALAISQAVIVETYAVVTFFSIGAYYFVLKKKWLWASAFIGMGVVTHHLIFLTWMVLFVFHRELRPNLKLNGKFPFIHLGNMKPFLVTCGFLVFYIYMPLSKMFTDQPNMWGNTTFKSFFTNNISVFTMLIGQIPIYDLPKRILDSLGVLGISLGLGLPIVIWYFFKIKTWKNELMWLFIMPVAWQVGDLAPQCMKYMEASVAWGAIITVMVLAKYGWKWALPVWVSAISLLGINGYMLDIQHLDPNLSATQFYEKEIPKMKDGDIFVTQGAWEWIEIFLYNKQNDRHIETVCMGILASPDYQHMLMDKGIKLKDYDIGDSQASNELNKKQVEVALSIIELNDRVFTSIPTDPATYGSAVVSAKENTDQIKKWLGSANVTPVWHWKPDSPFSCISGDIEVEKWNFILQSNQTLMKVCVYAGIPIIAIYALWKKKDNKKNRE